MFRVTWNKTGNATVYSNAVQAPWNREHNTSLIFESFSLVTGRVRAKQVCIIASGGALNTWAISSVHGDRKQKSVGKSAFMRLILFVRALLYNKFIPRGIWTHQSLHFLSLWLKTQWTVKWPVGITVKTSCEVRRSGRFILVWEFNDLALGYISSLDANGIFPLIL